MAYLVGRMVVGVDVTMVVGLGPKHPKKKRPNIILILCVFAEELFGYMNMKIYTYHMYECRYVCMTTPQIQNEKKKLFI